MTTDLSSRFSLPAQDRGIPSPTQSDPAALTQWLDGLPKTSLGETTRALFEYITQFNRVPQQPALRLKLLDVLRPAIHFAAAGLSRHYLNQPIVLPEQAQKVARLAHVLFQELATGYTIVALETLAAPERSGFAQPRQALAIAVHRALTDHTQNLLRDCQLYRNPQRNYWLQVHALAQLAWDRQLDQFAAADAQSGDGTLEATYLRTLLLGCAGTYQLRQEDLARLYSHLLDWSRMASLCGRDEGLFVVIPNRDQGPVYRQYLRDDAPKEGTLGLDTRALAAFLERQRSDEEQALTAPDALGNDLLLHLQLTWSNAGTRAHVRRSVSEPVDIALGLTAAHHFCAGGMDFALLLNKDGYTRISSDSSNPFLRQQAPAREQRPRDVWDSPYSSNSMAQIPADTIDYNIRKQHRSEPRDKHKYECYTVETVNISPGGYCVKWAPGSARQLRTGELLGIRERNHKNWSIGVIRWVRLLESGPQLGIELLSPAATPYGARVVQKTGPQGEFQRILMLPEIKQTGQPTTLITPRLPFRSGQKVVLMHRDRESRVQLTRRVSSTPAFSQFEFRVLGGAAPGTAGRASAGDTGFDSLWDTL